MATLYKDLTTKRAAPGGAEAAAAQQRADLALLNPIKTATPTPVVTPQRYTSSSMVERYAPERETIRNNPALNVPEPSDTGIREKYRANAQATIDAIRSQFDRYITEDTEAKKKLESKAYLTSLASGLSGSPTGAAKTSEAAEKGEKKIRQTISDREALINKALSDADLRASDEYEKRRQEYLGSASDRVQAEQKLNENVRGTAEKEIAAYASSRSYDEWANQVGENRVRQYMNETGRDENGLRALFLQNVKNDLVDTSGTKLSDGSIVFMKKVYDENGNLTGTKEISRIQGSAGKTIKDSRLTDNGIQILYTDGTYEERGKGNVGNSPTFGKKVPGAPSGVTDTEVEVARTKLSTVGASAGYASPYLYRDAFDDWISKGGDRVTFIKLFPPEKYINPAHKNMKAESGEALFPPYLIENVKVPATKTEITNTSSTGRTY